MKNVSRVINYVVSILLNSWRAAIVAYAGNQSYLWPALAW
jgi:hypothetical protein